MSSVSYLLLFLQVTPHEEDDTADRNDMKLIETNLPYPRWIINFRDSDNVQVITYAGDVNNRPALYIKLSKDR